MGEQDNYDLRPQREPQQAFTLPQNNIEPARPYTRPIDRLVSTELGQPVYYALSVWDKVRQHAHFHQRNPKNPYELHSAHQVLRDMRESPVVVRLVAEAMVVAGLSNQPVEDENATSFWADLAQKTGREVAEKKRALAGQAAEEKLLLEGLERWRDFYAWTGDKNPVTPILAIAKQDRSSHGPLMKAMHKLDLPPTPERNRREDWKKLNRQIRAGLLDMPGAAGPIFAVRQRAPFITPGQGITPDISIGLQLSRTTRTKLLTDREFSLGDAFMPDGLNFKVLDRGLDIPEAPADTIIIPTESARPIPAPAPRLRTRVMSWVKSKLGLEKKPQPVPATLPAAAIDISVVNLMFYSSDTGKTKTRSSPENCRTGH